MMRIKIERDVAILLILVTCASVFSIVTVVQTNTGLTVLSPQVFNIAHMILEIFAISVCLSIFGIRLSSGSITKDMQSLLLGVTFFAVGLLELFHVLSYPGMATSSHQSTFDTTTYFWIFSRFTMIIPLLVVAFFPVKSVVRTFDVVASISAAILYSISLLLVILLSAASLPHLYLEGGGVSWVERGLEYAIISLFIIGIIGYWRLGTSHKDLTGIYLAAALLVGTFGELSFTLFGNEFGLINLMGHVFIFFSFLFVLLALLRESIIIPSRRLRLTGRKLEKEHKALLESFRKLELKSKEFEEEKTRAKAYFDFLAHDIANIISPIMAYSEMMLSDRRSPKEIRDKAGNIQKQCRRADSLIRNLRKLEEMGMTHPDEIESMDLRTILSATEDTIRNEQMEKRFTIEYDIPSVDRIIVKGGKWIEDVFHDVLDNAVRYSPTDGSRIEVKVISLEGQPNKAFWQIEISDNGPGISNNQRDRLTDLLSISKREFKGVASSLPFCASIVKYLGGELRIEDRMPGNPTKGTKVIIILPKGD